VHLFLELCNKLRIGKTIYPYYCWLRELDLNELDPLIYSDDRSKLFTPPLKKP